MEDEMNIYYDEEGDFLEITSGDISECAFENRGNGLFEIVDKKIKKVKGIAIFGFKNRTKSLDTLKLALPFKFSILSNS